MNFSGVVGLRTEKIWCEVALPPLASQMCNCKVKHSRTASEEGPAPKYPEALTETKRWDVSSIFLFLVSTQAQDKSVGKTERNLSDNRLSCSPIWYCACLCF